MRPTRRTRILCGLLAGLMAVTCADRQRRNPLDPEASNPVEGTAPLRATAGHGQVRLAWDYTLFDDVAGVRLYRSGGGRERVRTLAASATGLVDGEVLNGTTYQYSLGLLLDEGGERRLDEVAWATPGPGVVWVADRRSGWVWQISPDGRSTRFAQGRFYLLSALALNRADGSCWVSDERLAGLHRIGRNGALTLRAARLGRPGSLSISRSGELAWIADLESRRVSWFVPSVGLDSLALNEADASFAEPVGLAAVDQACWIVDRAAGRVLLYQRDGARLGEWHGLDHPHRVAAGQDLSSPAWVLTAEGTGAVELTADGTLRALDLPFAPVLDLCVDGATGVCWLLGEDAVAAAGGDGPSVALPETARGGVRLVVDENGGALWVARGQDLWHLDAAAAGAPTARLTGFSGLVDLVVDPGDG